ncbi:MmpS family transport accessory protein [Streptomyces sp. HMX87]|uniref:MmpS family transport accessory protein n=1 Tax=Streptomyces sp. HMX87 TaxID=3390849 RepID=UPI003A83F8D9
MGDEDRKTAATTGMEVKGADGADGAGEATADGGATPDGAATGDRAARAGRPGRPDRAALLAGAAVLAACAGLVLYGVLDTGDGNGKPEHRTATTSVTYEVTGQGTADITYQGGNASGKGSTVDGARLPWRKTVDVPAGTQPVVSIVLGDQGGQARCALAVRGQHVQSASAAGRFGRATCTGSLPSPVAPADGTEE